jgi:lysozyme family protein
MISNYTKALAFTLKWEGGIEGKCDDPADRGGRTCAGVTQRTFDDWMAGMNAVPGRDVWTITPAEVSAIYEVGYWDKCRCDQLPDKLDMCVFDSAVNHGPRKAIQFLQRAVGVVDDGVLGPQTMRALDQDKSAGRMEYVLTAYLAAREHFYAAIVHRDPTQERFLKGWMNRLNDLRSTVGVDT